MADRAFPQPVIAPGSATDRDVYTVARLLGEVRQLLEQGFAEIWIEGEITNLVKAGSGHYYFSLKDESAEVRCALFRTRADALGIDVADGSKVCPEEGPVCHDGAASMTCNAAPCRGSGFPLARPH